MKLIGSALHAEKVPDERPQRGHGPARLPARDGGDRLLLLGRRALVDDEAD